eukprot:1082527-Pleurochrysis_carterae.AAC.2
MNFAFAKERTKSGAVYLANAGIEGRTYGAASAFAEWSQRLGRAGHRLYDRHLPMQSAAKFDAKERRR